MLGQLEERLGVGKTEGECVQAFIQLRDASLQCWRTGAYDMLQKVLPRHALVAPCLSRTDGCAGAGGVLR